MSRSSNSDSRGEKFDIATINVVWGKGAVIPSFDRNVWRYDCYGKPIRFSDYGNTQSEYGWEIDHIRPVNRGGGDELSNLQPLQWLNNRVKGDKYLLDNIFPRPRL